MLFTWAFLIALINANYFNLYTGEMMSHLRHVKYGNDPLNELNTTVYADSQEETCGQRWTQMYMIFCRRVQKCMGYRYPINTVVGVITIHVGTYWYQNIISPIYCLIKNRVQVLAHDRTTALDLASSEPKWNLCSPKQEPPISTKLFFFRQE